MHWHGRVLLLWMALKLGCGVLARARRGRPPGGLHWRLLLLHWQVLLLRKLLLLLLQCLRPLQQPHPWERLPGWGMGQPVLLLLLKELGVRPVWGLHQALLGLRGLGARVGLRRADAGLRLRGQGPHACLCCCCMVGVPVQVHCCSVHRLGATKGVSLLARRALRQLCRAALPVHAACGAALRRRWGLQ